MRPQSGSNNMGPFYGHLLVLLALVAVLVPRGTEGQQRRPGNASCKREEPFDVLMMALQWPPAVCHLRECIDHPQKWLIHGNWPSNTNGSHPSFCCYQKDFNPVNVKGVESKLLEKWTTLWSTGTDQAFWRHEWRKHGTCAATVSSLKGQANYFEQTLEMFDKLKLEEWLKEANVTPGSVTDPKKYSLQQVHSALESKVGARVGLECRRLPRRSGLRDPLLSGLYICYDPKTLQFTDCPKPDDQDCGNRSVLFVANGTPLPYSFVDKPQSSASFARSTFTLIFSLLLFFVFRSLMMYFVGYALSGKF